MEILNENNLTIQVNSDIKVLELNMVFHLSLNEKLIEPRVFALTRELGVSGTIDSIQEGLFKKLHELFLIFLGIQNIRQFFYSSTNRWMKHLFSQGMTYETKVEMESFLSANSKNLIGFFPGSKT